MVDQPGAGTTRSYKIRGHTRQRRTTKPYARPSQVKRKGLIEKVRDYLTPSWFFGYFQKNEEDIEDSSDSEVDIIDTTSNDVRLDLDRDDGLKENITGLSPTIEEDSMLEDAGEINLHAVSSSGSEETVPKHLNLSKYLENNNNGETCRHEGITVESHETEDCLTDAPADDGIVSTTTSSSSYSSQLKRKPLPSLHTRTLKSSLFQHSSTPATLLPGNSLLLTTRTAGFSSQPQNIALSRVNMPASMNTVTSLSSLRKPQRVSSTPGFSVSTFVTPVPRIFTNKRTESPFYPGRIAYGGALSNSGYITNSGKRQRRHSPSSEVYQPVRKQQIRAKPLPNATRVGPTTQTAQRILEALESISSPLKDVHRIPSPLVSPSASPLSFSPSQSRTKPPRIGPRVGPRVSSLQAKLLGGPPVEALSSPQIAKVTGIDSREGNQHRSSSTPFPTSDDPSSNWLNKSLFSGLNDTVLKTSFPAAFTPKSLPTSLSPGEKTSNLSGKMRCVLHGSKHYSFKNNPADQETINPLPEIVHAIPLPVNTTKNMSTFLISSNKETELLKTNPMQDNAANESTKNGFVFSTPKTKLPTLSVKEALSRADDEVSFVFSQPISVKTKTNKDMKSKSGNSKTVSNPSISSTNKPSPTQTSLAKMFDRAHGEWDCSTCMVRNKTAGQKCVACGTVGVTKTISEQPEKSEATEIARNRMDLAKKFAPAEGTWDCETCMINNTATALKCVACNTKKPGTSTSLEPGVNKEETTDLKITSPPANTWECGTCMIRNKMGENKCVACTTPKPGFTESNLKEKFAAPTGSWECEICMINNEASAIKCMACQNSKPGAEAGASQTTFSFGLNAPAGTSSDKSSSSSSGGFTFGGAVRTSTSFTIGNSVPESNSGVTFGSGSSAIETTSGFTFGSSSSKEQNTTPQFTFGSVGSGNDVTELTFAGSNKSSSGRKEQSKETPNEDINKVAVQAPLNIAQAAAAGLLKVPGIGNTQLKNKKVSTSQPTFSQPSSKSPPNCPASSLPKNLPDSTTVPPLLSKTTPLVAAAIEKSTTETVKITPFNFNAVASTSSAISSSTVATTNLQNVLGEKPANPGFCFGMVQPASKPKTTPFSFGAQSSTDKKVDKSTFVFGTNTATTTKQSSAAPVFKFGAAEQSTAVSTGSLSLFQNTATTSTVSETKTQTSSLFAFAGDGKAEDKPKQSLFNFGNLNGPSLSTRQTTSTQAAPAENAMFNFNTGQTSNVDTENHNSLGGEDMEADSNSNHDNGQAAFSSTGNFNFAVQTPANSSGLFGPSGTSGTSGTPSGFTFGSGGIPTTFQFGTSSNPNNNTPSGGFNFGPSNAAPVGSSPFLFGGAPGNIASNVPTNSSAPSAGFAFSASTPTPSSFNVGTTSTPGGFSVGATPQSGQRVIKKAVRRSRHK